MKVIVILCDTLRRDHCSAYTGGRPLNQCWGDGAPDWAVPTPNMQRLADRGTTFDRAWCGSTPCMPARRDIYTGRFEFLERGWGPLEEFDRDLPRQVSGTPNRSIGVMLERGEVVSQLITDHFHLWEQGACNYHAGYTGHLFIRGIEADAYRTDYLEPGSYDCPPGGDRTKLDRHWRNMHLIGRQREEDWTAARVFGAASDWLERNHRYEKFYLHIDCFPPHEPLDPPEAILKQFWPAGYDVDPAWRNGWGYNTIERLGFSADRVRFCQALYAANVVLVDRWLGRLLDTMDRLNLWDDTLVIFTTDHGTFNGDHGRLGKLQTHQFGSCGHIPFIICHPSQGHGQRRRQLVQLVDIYPTVLGALGRPLPKSDKGRPLHGVDLLPVLADPHAPMRDYAIAGQFGRSMSITDGRWVLHQSPAAGNQPLHWYGYHLARFIPYDLGPFNGVSRPARCETWDTPTWLSDTHADPGETTNLASRDSVQLRKMQQALAQTLTQLEAPPEQLRRLGLDT